MKILHLQLLLVPYKTTKGGSHVPFYPVPFGLSPDKGHKKGAKKGQIFVKKW